MPWVLGLTVLFLFTTLVVLQSSNYWRTLFELTERDTVLLYALISLNFFAFIVFGFILLRSVLKLLRERRALTLGAKIKTRLLVYFTLISILPIIAMALFSYLFMNRALERWFTQIPETVAREARDIRDRSIQERTEQYAATARTIAATLRNQPINSAMLSEIATNGGFAFVAVASDGDEIIEASSANNSVDKAVIQASMKPSAEAAETGQFNIFTAPLADGKRLVIATRVGTDNQAGQMIEGSLAEYTELKEQQNTIRQLGILTLGVLTFLLLFASSWMAFYVARGFTAPIMALAEGADHIAKGELGYTVDTIAEDELETLVDAFNQMSARLEENSAELTERQRYIETVLNTLPTGVISVDAEGKISTINPAAWEMLCLDREEFVGRDFSVLVHKADREIFERVITRAKRVGHASDQSTLQIEPNDEGVSEVSVSLTATALPDGGGAVLVIEDLSELIAAQRASAWREVARRMAHEIKNPLTPIQLSAERIAKRALSEPEAVATGLNAAGFDVRPSYSSDMTANVIREGTDTILREVQSLKSMVDEFSQFARLPNVELELGNVNHVIEQAATLYIDRADVRLETRIDPVVPETKIDAEQLKRVFVNLIDNAIEAPVGAEAKSVVISSRFDAARDLVVVEVSDNGQGIDPADYQKLFQPYFSTKGRETGLGLAIVQRIIAEHHGKVKAVPNQPQGAKFIIELPV